jgi:hypothetical protein
VPVGVGVVGIKDVMNGLDFMNEDMRDRIRKAIDPVMRNVAYKAKSYVPGNSEVLSGWSKAGNPQINYRPFPKYDAATVSAGIGYNAGQNKTFKNGFSVSNYVYNVSAAGRIYETAGRKNPQGRAPFQQIDPSRPYTTFGKVQGFEGKKKAKEYTYNRSTREYSSNNPFAGYQFVTSMPGLTSQPKVKDVRSGGRKTKGRLIYKAWAQDSGKVYEAILNAINATATHFNKSTEVKKAA